MALNGPESWAPWAPWSHDSPSCMARSPQSSCKSSFVAQALALALGALRCKTARMPWAGWLKTVETFCDILVTQKGLVWGCLMFDGFEQIASQGVVIVMLAVFLDSCWRISYGNLGFATLSSTLLRCKSIALCVCVSLVFLWFHNQMYFEIVSLVAIQCCNGVQIPDQVWTENLMYSMFLCVKPLIQINSNLAHVNVHTPHEPMVLYWICCFPG
jgi:hypothetical protein